MLSQCVFVCVLSQCVCVCMRACVSVCVITVCVCVCVCVCERVSYTIISSSVGCLVHSRLCVHKSSTVLRDFKQTLP